jgi:superfamily II DNA or RNA helicase
MTRDEILQEILALQGDNWLLELATGTGKSKLALELIKNHSNNKGKLLIVVPRNVLKANWQNEIKKWWPNCKMHIEYVTYVSFHKMLGHWDFAIFDEAHHTTQRVRSALKTLVGIDHSILCSATISKNLLFELSLLFPNLATYKKDLRDVINDNILPDPKVYLLPLQLEFKKPTETIYKNKKAKGTPIECGWATRWNYLKQKEHPVIIRCTEFQYYTDLSSQIEYWKKRYLSRKSEIAKNKWLRLCGDRLKWLSDKKFQYVVSILRKVNKYRTLTFCNSIEQTEKLGKFCINSKNPKSLEYLEYFNNGTIDHITACNMVNEGMNLTNCQVGIYANLNSSEAIIKQRMGRLLRHPNPVIIIPYYKNTREEELVKVMLEDYNPSLVTVISNENDIKI